MKLVTVHQRLSGQTKMRDSSARDIRRVKVALASPMIKSFNLHIRSNYSFILFYFFYFFYLFNTFDMMTRAVRCVFLFDSTPNTQHVCVCVCISDALYQYCLKQKDNKYCYTHTHTRRDKMEI